MKVAITSSGSTADSLLDQRFGRCAYFAIYDTDSKDLTFIENPNLNAAEGAGPASVSLVANQKVSKIISGEFGFKIKGMLNDLHIQMVMLKEEKTIADIVAMLQQ